MGVAHLSCHHPREDTILPSCLSVNDGPKLYMRSSPRSSLKVTTSLADKMADPVSEAALTDGDGEREREFLRLIPIQQICSPRKNKERLFRYVALCSTFNTVLFFVLSIYLAS